jgi:hypothetical protein
VDWITPVGGSVVAVAGLVFGWASTVRSQRQTAELARENNRHAQALAELSGEQALALERLDHERRARDQHQQSYVEIATTVVRLSTTVTDEGVTAPEELVRARVMAGLFARPPVRALFDDWLACFDRLRFALERRSASGDDPPPSTRDLQSPRDMWRRQGNDARLREVEARERLITAMAAELADPDAPTTPA